MIKLAQTNGGVRADVYLYDRVLGKLGVTIALLMVPLLFGAQSSYARELMSWLIQNPWHGLGLFVALVVVQLIPVYLKSRTLNFQVLTTKIVYRAGAWKKSELPLPISRIRHVKKDQTVISRLFDLYYMHIYTEGSDGAEIKVGPMTESDVDRYSAQLVPETSTEATS